jgi:deoxycytidylate deaminase
MSKTSIRLERAASIATRSSLGRFWTGAAIYNHNEPVSVGWSHFSDLRLQRYRSIHAELHAILRTRVGGVRGGEIYIATVRSKSGNIGLAKPCQVCQELLWEVGLHSIYYTVRGDRWAHLVLE